MIDFEKLDTDSYDSAFKQDVIYCCLGTTRGKSGKVKTYEFSSFPRIPFYFLNIIKGWIY